MDTIAITEWLFMVPRIVGVVYISAGMGKLFFHGDFARTIHALPIIPIPLKLLASYGLPWFELFLGIFILIGVFLRYVSIVSVILLIVFNIIILLTISKKVSLPCACFGAASSDPMSVKTVYRNMALILLTIPLFVSPEMSPFTVDYFISRSQVIKVHEVALLAGVIILVFVVNIIIMFARRTLMRITPDSGHAAF